MRAAATYEDHTYALLRIVAGFLFSFHGAQIILRIFAEGFPPVPPGSQLWIGGLIELIGGLLIMVGFLTRYAALICSGTMAVAYFQFHWRFQGGRMLFPALNQGEPATLFCFLFLFIMCRGAGIWSVDQVISSRGTATAAHP